VRRHESVLDQAPEAAAGGKGLTMPMLTIYGIPNCDTVKRARA